jgi:hypothetical protein
MTNHSGPNRQRPLMLELYARAHPSSSVRSAAG